MKTYKIPHTNLTVSRMAYGAGLLASVLNFKGPLVAGGQTDEAIAKWKMDHKKDAIANWTQVGPKPGTTAAAARLIHTAVDQGITLFDHSGYYAFGKGEETFGEVLKQSPGLRERIVIQSKCGLHFGGGDFFEQKPGDPPRVDLSRRNILSAVEDSLRRMHIEHLDLLLLNRPDPLMELEEVAEAFDELQRSGKVRYFGVSNHTPMQIELLKRYVRQRLVVNQVQLSLAFPHLITEGLDANRDDSSRMAPSYSGAGNVLDYCRLHDIQIQAYSPLRGGNRVLAPDLLRPGSQAPESLKNFVELVANMAREKGTTPAALALAWLLRHPARIVPILGASNPEHIAEDCAAEHIDLTPAEWYELFVASLGVPGLFLFGVVMPKKYVQAGELARKG